MLVKLLLLALAIAFSYVVYRKGWSVFFAILANVIAVLVFVFGDIGKPISIPDIFEKSNTKTNEYTYTPDGKFVTFGSYEQDNDLSNGNDDLKWIVLDEVGDQRLLITAQVIDAVRYNNVWEETSWKSSTLRAWLNDAFLKEAFTEEERKRIVAKERYDKNGIETSDRVFIMNIQELHEYFNSMEDRKTGATPYAKAQGVYEYQDTVWWWVSDAGESENGEERPFYAAYVNCLGDILENGMLVFNSDFGIRPAIWVR